MRIIDMSGKRSFNMDYLDIIVDEKDVFGKNMDIMVSLGRYKTVERAIMVFENIHWAYENDAKLFYMPSE